MNGNNMIAYMDRVDFTYELGEAMSNFVYTCIETLKQQRKCSVDCGIVEVLIQENIAPGEDSVAMFVPDDWDKHKVFTVHSAKTIGTSKKVITLNKIIEEGQDKRLYGKY